MKKLVFVLIALFCIFLVGCKEKQIDEKMYDMPVDNRINLNNNQNVDTLSHEQEENIEETLQVAEQKDNNFSALSSELNQVENITEVEEYEDKVILEGIEGQVLPYTDESILSDELETKIKELVCKKNNEKLPSGFKELIPDNLVIMEYFGGFGENNNIHVLLMKGIIIDNKVVAVYTPFYSVTINQSGDNKFYMFKRLPELIFVVNLNDNNIYTLADACDKSMLTINDMDLIYEQYKTMVKEINNEK